MKKAIMAQAVILACGTKVQITSNVDDSRIGVWQPLHAEITHPDGTVTKEFSPKVMFGNGISSGTIISGLKGSNADGSFTVNDESITIALIKNRIDTRPSLVNGQ